jgi:hypothetical protein
VYGYHAPSEIVIFDMVEAGLLDHPFELFLPKQQTGIFALAEIKLFENKKNKKRKKIK